MAIPTWYAVLGYECPRGLRVPDQTERCLQAVCYSIATGSKHARPETRPPSALTCAGGGVLALPGRPSSHTPSRACRRARWQVTWKHWLLASDIVTAEPEIMGSATMVHLNCCLQGSRPKAGLWLVSMLVGLRNALDVAMVLITVAWYVKPIITKCAHGQQLRLPDCKLCTSAWLGYGVHCG